MLTIHTGNKLENLAAQLVESLRKPLTEPFAREVIVVQSGGMARWLTHEIARHDGIAMNIEAPFPREFIRRVLRVYFSNLPDTDDFSPEMLAWRIHSLLPSLEKKRAFGEVHRYLKSGDALMRFQLAEKIACVFDQYLLYRPEMLMNWTSGGDEHDWQAVLWRELTRERAPDLAAISGRLAHVGKKIRDDNLPERVSIFGIASLPPIYLRIFFELSRHCEVQIFSLQPANEYFGHDLPPKESKRLIARLAEKGVKIYGDEIPEGNPLLASLGRLHRDFTELRLEIDEQCGHLAHEAEHFEEIGDDNLLRVVQSDILHARLREEAERKKIAPDDFSIAIHSCHSPMREIEVLYDQLLALFDADSKLRPRDIMVLAPDIEKYAPFVQAVFDCPEDESRRIPFSLADRHPRSASAAMDTYLALLELAESRFPASKIFSLLEREAIRRRFGFSGGDLDIIRQWIVESGVRWGIDRAHRKSFDVPAIENNSWRSGIDRLLLSFAMDGENRRMFENILPCAEIEGSRAELLGRFLSALEAMFRLGNEIPQARPLAQWPDVFAKILDDFFSQENADEVAELRVVRGAIEQLRKIAANVNEMEKIEFRVARRQLENLLDEGEQRGGFLTGGVTFCSLKLNRSIPARIVCLIGMDDAAFPRRSHPLAFDKIAACRKTGDRSARDDDRAMFLEAMLSARDRVHISYIGRSARDNEPQPPSVLVGELLDYLDRACVFPEKKNAREFLVTEHRLHAFSPIYFSKENARLFSFSSANAAAGRALLRPPEKAPVFFPAPLPEPDATARSLELRAFTEFFVNPAKHFLKHRLGMTLDESGDALEDNEPFDLDSLASYSLKQELLKAALAGDTMDAAIFRARGVLPPGSAGDARFADLRAGADEFLEKVRHELNGAKCNEPVLISLPLGDFFLSGKIESIYDNRLAFFRCAKLKAKDRIRAWISHLAFCASREKECAPSLLLGTGEKDHIEFPHTPDARKHLAQLLEIYWRGQTQPLPFFPESAFAFASAKGGGDWKNRFNAARKMWEGWRDGKGEKENAWFAFCFSERDPLDEIFEQLACDVFSPILETEVTA